MWGEASGKGRWKGSRSHEGAPPWQEGYREVGAGKAKRLYVFGRWKLGSSDPRLCSFHQL